MAYHDAIRHDGPALELAELVDGELGPALVIVLFADSAGATEVLLTDCGLPLPVLTAFMAEVADEERRLSGRDSAQALAAHEPGGDAVRCPRQRRQLVSRILGFHPSRSITPCVRPLCS